MSETNKAFERYMGKDTDDDLRSVYKQSAGVVPFHRIGGDPGNGEWLEPQLGDKVPNKKSLALV